MKIMKRYSPFKPLSKCILDVLSRPFQFNARSIRSILDQSTLDHEAHKEGRQRMHKVYVSMMPEVNVMAMLGIATGAAGTHSLFAGTSVSPGVKS
jgi:hypothetical protein